MFDSVRFVFVKSRLRVDALDSDEHSVSSNNSTCREEGQNRKAFRLCAWSTRRRRILSQAKMYRHGGISVGHDKNRYFFLHHFGAQIGEFHGELHHGGEVEDGR